MATIEEETAKRYELMKQTSPWTAIDYIEAQLAAKDARIAELESMNKKSQEGGWTLANALSALATELDNKKFYVRLLDECAEYLGKAVFECEDGTVATTPLRLRVPELVKAQTVEIAALKSRITELERELTNWPIEYEEHSK